VNEIDVRKVAAGQPAFITLDADPDRRLVGKVTKVANMGEQRPNSDAKVFEVRVAIEGADTTLRPGMTTGNIIQTYELKNALAVSLEALHNQDSIPFVYKQRGGGVVKQEIETGAVSDNEVVVTRGLDEGDRVLLVVPSDAAALEMVRLPNSKAGMRPAGGDTAETRRLDDSTAAAGRPGS
jgi:hypothetical protein